VLPLLRDDVSAATEGVRAPALQAACGSVRRRRRHMTSTRQQCDQAECCSICLEVLPLPSQEDPVTVLPCNHCFHESCVDPLWHALLDKVTAVPRVGSRRELDSITTPCPVCRGAASLFQFQRVPKARKLSLRQEKKQDLRFLHRVEQKLDQLGARIPRRRAPVEPAAVRASAGAIAKRRNAIAKIYYTYARRYEQKYGESPRHD
jgi:hypothetical protein